MTVVMTRLGQAPRQRRDVLVAPVNLTPNGRAHLGHVAGPFLRMDILARALARDGDRVAAVLTTDGFENHVLLKAWQEGRDPDELAHANAMRIRDDLAAIGIDYTLFDDPGHAENRALFDAVFADLVRRLEEGGEVAYRSVRLPVDRRDADPTNPEDRFCIGGWFVARCPNCEAPGGAFVCEECGRFYEPTEGLEPRSQRGDIVGWEEDTAPFVVLRDPDRLRDLWTRMGLEAPYREIGERQLAQVGPAIRLTVPGRRGLDWAPGPLTGRQVGFSYSSIMYAHKLYCGERLAGLTGRGNPFTAGSETVLVSATGIDNTIPMLIGVGACSLAQSAYRPFDRMYFNRFVSMERSKFSTSRGHVIWVGDIAAAPGLNTDCLRLYLAEICPEEAETDLAIDELIARHNAILAALRHLVPSAWAGLGSGASVVDDGLARRLEAALAGQASALDPERLRVSRGAAVVADWIFDPGPLDTPGRARGWLVGLALLAAPWMPELAGAIWRGLGHPGVPRTEAFAAGAAVAASPEPPAVPGLPLTRRDLVTCGALKEPA